VVPRKQLHRSPNPRRPIRTVAAELTVHFYRRRSMCRWLKYIREEAAPGCLTTNWVTGVTAYEEGFRHALRLKLTYVASGADRSSLIKTLQNVYSARDQEGVLVNEYRWIFGDIKFLTVRSIPDDPRPI